MTARPVGHVGSDPHADRVARHLADATPSRTAGEVAEPLRG
ncbi:hypothetical protein Q5530_08030 [Saccharothrix sp. BKS2]